VPRSGVGLIDWLCDDSLENEVSKSIKTVMVPEEPTYAMLFAAKKFQCDHDTFDGWMEFCGRDVIGQHKAMIAAAQPQEMSMSMFATKADYDEALRNQPVTESIEAYRVQQWLLSEHDMVVHVDDVARAMATPFDDEPTL